MIDPTTPTPTATAPAAGAPATADPASATTEDTWTRRLLVLVSLIVVGLSVLAIVGVMCARVWIDGNSSLTNDITSKLMWIAIVCISSMVAALFGSNSLVSKAIDKLGL